MPKLRYFPEQFGAYMGVAFTASNEITFSWEELCRSAITVGRKSWADVLQFGTYSRYEMGWRLGILYANLREGPDGELQKTRAFERLDPSEKGAISYFLGLVVAKLVAERLFGVAWLLHLDVYSQSLNPTVHLGEKPDFVGMDTTRRWVVIESKGRTHGITAALMQDAKRQTRSLRNIGGALPVLRAVVAGYFSGQRLRARVRDPEDYDNDASDLMIEAPQLVRSYYQPLMEFIEVSDHKPRQDTETGSTIIRAELPLFDAALEIEETILEWYASPRVSFDELLAALPRRISVLEEIEQRRAGNEETRTTLAEPLREKNFNIDSLQREQPLGSDGVSVRLGNFWSTERMRREPEERGS
jgi:hypothetical protein